MQKPQFIFTLITFALALSPFSAAQKDAKKIIPEALPKEVIFKKISVILNEDLSNLKHPIKPMLWKVEGKGLKKASYLFGSMHVADKNIVTLHPDAEAAYQQADTLATEVNKQGYKITRQ